MRDYWAFFVASLLALLSVNFVVYSCGWYLLHLGSSPMSVGVSFFLFFAPGVLILPVMSTALARKGVARSLVKLQVGSASAVAAIGAWLLFIPSPAAAYILIATLGMFFGYYFPSLYVLVKRIVPTEHVPRRVAQLEVAVQLGSILGVVAAGFLFAQLGFVFLVFSSAAMALLAGFSYAHITPGIVDGDEHARDAQKGWAFGSTVKCLGNLLSRREARLRGWFLVCHGLPQVVVLALNIPILLYVQDTMKAGSDVYGIFDGMFGVGSMLAGFACMRFSTLFGKKVFVIALPVGTMIIIAIARYVPTDGLAPFAWIFVASFTLGVTKVQGRTLAIQLFSTSQASGEIVATQMLNTIILLLSCWVFTLLSASVAAEDVFLIAAFILVPYVVSLLISTGFAREECVANQPTAVRSR
ncbi:MFS transporter [Azospirillum argentinense]